MKSMGYETYPYDEHFTSIAQECYVSFPIWLLDGFKNFWLIDTMAYPL